MSLTIAVQYLEHIHPGEHTPEAVRLRLQAAFDQLPIALVLLGWNAPRSLVDACASVTAQHNARLFLWHPLLTSDGVFTPHPAWQPVGLSGEAVPGYQNDPEFTFACPNHPLAREAALERLFSVLHGKPFQGVFLDRIRFPSPAAAPDRHLACFCESCCQAASQEGLDLEAVRLFLAGPLSQPEAGQALVMSLMNPQPKGTEPSLLERFLDFRQRSIHRIVQEAAQIACGQGMAVGLDCFSPSLSRMVGQDLTALEPCCEWIKTMTYTHTLAPAGLPFELLGLADWLITRYQLSEEQVLHFLTEASGFPYPASLEGLRSQGLPAQAIPAEVQLGRFQRIKRLLVGVALVDIPGINTVSTSQHAADLNACRTSGADGLVLSWDLWHITPERLEQVADIL